MGSEDVDKLETGSPALRTMLTNVYKLFIFRLTHLGDWEAAHACILKLLGHD
jgi:hypothetical protein